MNEKKLNENKHSNKRTKMSFILLSDLHFNPKSNHLVASIKALKKALIKNSATLPKTILILGDLINNSKIEWAQVLNKKLITPLREHNFLVLCVPGNHDVYRFLGNKVASPSEVTKTIAGYIKQTSSKHETLVTLTYFPDEFIERFNFHLTQNKLIDHRMVKKIFHSTMFPTITYLEDETTWFIGLNSCCNGVAPSFAEGYFGIYEIYNLIQLLIILRHSKFINFKTTLQSFFNQKNLIPMMAMDALYVAMKGILPITEKDFIDFVTYTGSRSTDLIGDAPMDHEIYEILTGEVKNKKIKRLDYLNYLNDNPIAEGLTDRIVVYFHHHIETVVSEIDETYHPKLSIIDRVIEYGVDSFNRVFDADKVIDSANIKNDLRPFAIDCICFGHKHHPLRCYSDDTWNFPLDHGKHSAKTDYAECIVHSNKTTEVYDENDLKNGCFFLTVNCNEKSVKLESYKF